MVILNPCNKCLVKAICTEQCEPLHEYILIRPLLRLLMLIFVTAVFFTFIFGTWTILIKLKVFSITVQTVLFYITYIPSGVWLYTKGIDKIPLLNRYQL